MNLESFRLYCLENPGVTAESPYSLSTLVFKVMWEIFALTGLDSPAFLVNLKCASDYAEELSAAYSTIIPRHYE
jgi:predicted DNA-binding protein (MmcQ/YjbR family)